MRGGIVSQDIRFFENFSATISEQIHVLQMCRVTAYNASRKRADVRPLALKSNGNERSLIQGALVLKHVENDIAVGKAVAVVFSDRDLENINGSASYRPSSKRQHSLNDAVVVGVWDG